MEILGNEVYEIQNEHYFRKNQTQKTWMDLSAERTIQQWFENHKEIYLNKNSPINTKKGDIRKLNLRNTQGTLFQYKSNNEDLHGFINRKNATMV